MMIDKEHYCIHILIVVFLLLIGWVSVDIYAKVERVYSFVNNYDQQQVAQVEIINAIIQKAMDVPQTDKRFWISVDSNKNWIRLQVDPNFVQFIVKGE